VLSTEFVHNMQPFFPERDTAHPQANSPAQWDSVDISTAIEGAYYHNYEYPERSPFL